MPSLRMLVAIVVLYVLFVIYSVYSNAAGLNAVQDFHAGNQATKASIGPVLQVKVTPPGKGAKKSTERDILGAYTNPDGTVTIAITACGSFIEVVTDMESVQRNNKALLDAANDAVVKACK